MISWHTLDAWTVPEDRTGIAFHWIIILGGCAAPLFLFLAGVSVSLSKATMKRGWQIFALAHLFRLQSFFLNPWASVSSLLKPDILDILGLGMVAAASCRARATTHTRQVLWLLGPAVAIVLIAPASRVWAWPALIRPYAPRLEAYIRPMAGMGVFTPFRGSPSCLSVRSWGWCSRRRARPAHAGLAGTGWRGGDRRSGRRVSSGRHLV